MVTQTSNHSAKQPVDGPLTQSPATLSSDDAEKGHAISQDRNRPAEKVSAFKSLGWLDRFLAVWIILAMVIGVLLGNFVPEVGPALQKGKFAEVSAPIGMLPEDSLWW